MKKEIITLLVFLALAHLYLWAINDQLKQSDIENKIEKIREIGGHELNL
jgi:hypothetical protein